VETGRMKQEYPCEMCAIEEQEQRMHLARMKQRMEADVDEQDHF